jgi:hypothetical protein
MNPLESFQKCWEDVSPVNLHFIKQSDFLSLPQEAWMDSIAQIVFKIEMLLDDIRGSKVGLYVRELIESTGVGATGTDCKGRAEGGSGEVKVINNVNTEIMGNDKKDSEVSNIMKNKSGQNSNKKKKSGRKK